MNKKLTTVITALLVAIVSAIWMSNPSKITESHPDGSLKLTKEYREGQPYGTWTTWNADGAKLLEVEFLKDSLIKELRTFHPNGYVKNSMVAVTSWPGEFTKGRDTVHFVVEMYDNKGNRVKNQTDSATVDDAHKGRSYLFPWYDGTDVVGSIEME